MKKSILIWALMLITVVGSSFANKTGDINQDLVTSFKKDFANATEVKWESGKEVMIATFTLNEQVLFAYYSRGGELLGVTRNMISGQLPINLLTSLKKNYGGFWISQLFEMSVGTDANYYVVLESADFTVILKSSGINNWEVFKKERKETN